MSACDAVGEGRARHVLVYRTVQMMGGSILPPAGARAAQPRIRRAAARARATVPPEAPRAQSDGRHGRTAHVPRVLGGELAGDALPSPHVPVRHHQGAARVAGGEQPPQRRAEPARGVPRADDARRLPVGPHRVEPVRPVRLRRADRRFDRGGGVDRRLRRRLPEPCRSRSRRPAGHRVLGGWTGRADYPKMASIEAAAEMWSRTDLTPRDRRLRGALRRLHVPHLRLARGVGDLQATARPGPSSRAAPASRSKASFPLNTYGGQLSAGRMHGYWVLHEACLQLRGGAGERQVPRSPEVAVVSNGGGPIAGCLARHPLRRVDCRPVSRESRLGDCGTRLR